MGAACVNSARFIGRTTGVRTMFQNNGIPGIPRLPDDVDPKIFARGSDHNLPEEITMVSGWAHARRKFDETMKSWFKGKAKGSSGAQGLAYCWLVSRFKHMDLSSAFNFLK